MNGRLRTADIVAMRNRRGDHQPPWRDARAHSDNDAIHGHRGTGMADHGMTVPPAEHLAGHDTLDPAGNRLAAPVDRPRTGDGADA